MIACIRPDMNINARTKKYLKAGIVFRCLFVCLVGCTTVLASSAAPASLKPAGQQDTITTATLLDEMAGLDRLMVLPLTRKYKTVQFSSYDRSSVSPDAPGWFSNSDGFGGAAHPAFEAVLRAPDENGVGTYLVCDVKQPGAIVRLWTAQHTGTIRMFLDGAGKPVFDGPAEDFYWRFSQVVAADRYNKKYDQVFRQYDAVYFPIAFSKGCRIEWTGNTQKVHFYQVNMRLYDQGVPVQTFSVNDYNRYAAAIAKAGEQLKGISPGAQTGSSVAAPVISVPGSSEKELLNISGEKVLKSLTLKVHTPHPETVLRQAVLSIWFDNASTPQVHMPVGDFFGAAPGINPYTSLPFSVEGDGTMHCRFPMPFKSSMRVTVTNHSGEEIGIITGADLEPYKWIEGQSMYFYARWRANHGITASPMAVQDIPYIAAQGKGRLVGIATHLFNPSPIPTGHGNWWGEGDEKIFVDNDAFPSFFGTGSEDYYNYSWSADKIFYHPYCGQPRDDGPTTRGFVTNFRWHIMDDIPFYSSIHFSMELFSHTVVPDMFYATAAYFYALPGVIIESVRLNPDDLRRINTPRWKPLAKEGAAGVQFVEAEKMTGLKKGVLSLQHHYVWSDSTIVLWTPQKTGARIKLTLPVMNEAATRSFALTMALLPDGGTCKVYLNGKQVRLENKEVMDLKSNERVMLRTFWAVGVAMNKGTNRLELEFTGDPAKDNKIGIDFLWLK